MSLKIKKMNTALVVWRSFKDLAGHRGTRFEIDFPEHIGDFKFVKKIFQDRRHNKFLFALYEDKNGKEFIAKQVSLKDPGLDEYWLRNEISVYESITNLYKEKGEEIKKYFPRFSIPKLAGVVDDNERLLGLIEKVEGETLFEIPVPERLKIMIEGINYFKYLNTIHNFKGQVMTSRSIWQIIIILFLALFGSLQKNIDDYKIIYKGFCTLFVNIPWLLTQTDKRLIHRDIGYSNILTGPNGNYLIDFELSALANPMFEVTQMAVGCWPREGFIESFLNSEFYDSIMKNKKERRLYKLFTIYSGIHALATHTKNDSPTAHKIEIIRTYLKHGLEI